MDEVYTAGMDGRCVQVTAAAAAPQKNSTAGGTLEGKKYMLSLTFNAPADAFDDDNQYLFKGGSIDDLFAPMHLNFGFGMSPAKLRLL